MKDHKLESKSEANNQETVSGRLVEYLVALNEEHSLLIVSITFSLYIACLSNIIKYFENNLKIVAKIISFTYVKNRLPYFSFQIQPQQMTNF